MPFERFTGSEKSFAQGKSGLCVILVDVSGSMEKHLASLDQALRASISEFPSARVFKFAVDVVEMTAFHNPTVSGNTNLNVALQKASLLNPSKTVLISDGYPDDGMSALTIADFMTGTIDTLWTTLDWNSDPSQARNFMKTLARRGRGAMRQAYAGNARAIAVELRKSVLSIPKIYNDHGIREQQPMNDRQRKVFVTGPQININAAQNEAHRVVRRIDVYHETEVHNHYGAVKEFHHGERESVDIEAGRAEVTVNRPDGYKIEHHEAPEPPRGLMKTLLFGPGRSSYRGELKSAPALPAPTEQPMRTIAYFSKQKVAR